MALRVSPEGVRDVRFAEQWRGYRTDEVDEFVDQVAEAFDQLERRLEEVAQRTALAEGRLAERGPDEDLGRTLVLAQRTADAAVEEAQTEAARLVNEAEERARSILDDLEVRKARLEGDIEARIQAELVEVSERRAALEADVGHLSSYVEHHRSRLIEELRSHLVWLERVGPLEPLTAPAPPMPVVPSTAETAGPVFDKAEGSGEAPGPQEPHEWIDVAAVVSAPDSAAAAGQDPTPAVEPMVDDLATGQDDRQEDDRVLDDLDVIPWGGPPDADDAAAGNDSDNDPFITELRRAVDDPEPLGPRDEPGEWGEDVDIYDRHREGPMRSRRRRRRP